MEADFVVLKMDFDQPAMEDELLAPLSDESLLEHLQQIERKLQRIAAAFLEEEDRHAAGSGASGCAAPSPRPR